MQPPPQPSPACGGGREGPAAKPWVGGGNQRPGPQRSMRGLLGIAAIVGFPWAVGGDRGRVRGGILGGVVQGFGWVLRRSVGVGGPLGLGAAVHIFVGHIEAPLLIRPYLARFERGELFALMSCGMAGIAGTVMVLYAALIGSVIPDALGNILMAAVISTPAALAIAALMVPFRPDATASAELAIADPPVSSMDAVAKGTRDGIVFLATIVASLVVVVALVSLVNCALGLLTDGEGDAI